MKRVTLYTKSGCTTCLKARQFLLRQGVHYTERDIFKHPLDERELRTLLTQHTVRELFSFRSPSVKALGLDVERLSDEELIGHMLREPRLIRRPLLSVGAAVTVGFDEDELLAAVQG